METILALAGELTIVLSRMLDGALTMIVVIGIMGLVILDIERRRY